MKTIMQILPALDHSGGGVERGTLDVAKYISERGYKSVIVSSGGTMAERFEYKGVLHYKLPIQKKNIYSYFSSRKKFKRILIEVNPSVVHVRSRWPAFCLNSLIKNKIPLVTTYHGTYNGNNNPLKKRYNSLMVEGDRVIAISNFIRKHILHHFPDSRKRLRTINRGIDTDYFNLKKVTQIRKEKFLKDAGIKEDKHIILLPGRLTQWKGHNIAIDAAKIICEKYPDIEFVMLFVGSEQNRTKYLRYLKKKTIDSNLSKNIFFLGTRSDMASIYSLSDVVLSTSVEEEAFGRITAEASSMSKPIIATNLGGSKDIIKHNQTGWLIEKSAPLLLADTIIKVIKKSQNEKDKMGRDARKRIIEEFGLNMMLKRTLEVYKEVYEEKHIDH